MELQKLLFEKFKKNYAISIKLDLAFSPINANSITNDYLKNINNLNLYFILIQPKVALLFT
jgi:hypothetical protein